MIRAAYSGTLGNAGYGRSYSLCEYARTYRIYLYVHPGLMYGSAAKRSVCAAHNHWVNILLQTLF